MRKTSSRPLLMGVTAIWLVAAACSSSNPASDASAGAGGDEATGGARAGSNGHTGSTGGHAGSTGGNEGSTGGNAATGGHAAAGGNAAAGGSGGGANGGGGGSTGVTHNAASCDASDVNAAIAAASPGDTVGVPAGDCTWSPSQPVIVDRTITLRGAGVGATNITAASANYNNGSLEVGGAQAVVTGFTFLFPAVYGVGISVGAGAASFRFTGNQFTASGANHEVDVFDIEGAYGVVDGNTFDKGAGDAELILVRGPDTSWTSPESMGTEDNVFVENNVFNDQGYLTDCNIFARCVVRFNTINGPSKVDAHGKCTNSGSGQNRGVRHMEVYNNLWTVTTGYWAAMELRGGTGRVFNNVSQMDTSNGSAFLELEEYATFDDNCFGYAPGCCCPGDYPCDDQIGVGEDPKEMHSEPYYLWNNIIDGTDWPVQNNDHELQNSACVAICGASYTSITQIQANRDYFVSAAKPAALSSYTPFTCPHPLTGITAACDSSRAGTAAY